MKRFVIQSHGRLQEWVAQEKDYFTDEALDYEFLVKPIITWSAGVQSVSTAPAEIDRGAFESIEEGRGCNLSAACHWTVNMAASAGHGKMWSQAYSIAPSGVFVPPESPIRKPEELASVPVTVGYHSGSHYSTLQGLEKFSGVKRSNSTLPACFSIGWHCLWIAMCRQLASLARRSMLSNSSAFARLSTPPS
jgi:hypothetical protein